MSTLSILSITGKESAVALKEELKAEAVAEGIVSGLGYTYVGTEFNKNGESGAELIIYIDKEGGVTLDDCEAVSRALDEPLDIANPVADPYILIVSSPGLDRALKTEREFAWAEGRDVDVKLFAKVDGKKDFSGKLIHSDEENFTIEDKEGKALTFAKKKTAIVRLHINF
ncbi:MAG: ribosome maturation factor RimP [Clostridiales bacterium]|nr:ribosome maturation factor RimP [Clostridiales bacterium]